MAIENPRAKWWSNWKTIELNGKLSIAYLIAGRGRWRNWDWDVSHIFSIILINITGLRPVVR
jgi:hypothetical protein